MGIDLEYSIQIKKDGELDYLPYLHDYFEDSSIMPNEGVHKYRRQYFRNSTCFQFMEDYLIKSGRYPNGNYAFYRKTESETDDSDNPPTVEGEYDYGHGWFTLKQLKKIIKNKKLKKQYLGYGYATAEEVSEYNGIIYCLKMIRDDVIRNVIGHTFDKCYCPKDSDVIICVAFNH